jgi:hypothetical protein
MSNLKKHPLLSPGYEPGYGLMDGSQMVDGEWWDPQFGCDSLQYVLDNYRRMQEREGQDLSLFPPLLRAALESKSDLSKLFLPQEYQ